MKTRGSTNKSLPAQNTSFPSLFDENAPELGLANLSSAPSPPSASDSETEDDASATTEEYSDNNSEDFSAGEEGGGIAEHLESLGG